MLGFIEHIEDFLVCDLRGALQCARLAVRIDGLLRDVSEPNNRSSEKR